MTTFSRPALPQDAPPTPPSTPEACRHTSALTCQTTAPRSPLVLLPPSKTSVAASALLRPFRRLVLTVKEKEEADDATLLGWKVVGNLLARLPFRCKTTREEQGNRYARQTSKESGLTLLPSLVEQRELSASTCDWDPAPFPPEDEIPTVQAISPPLFGTNFWLRKRRPPPRSSPPLHHPPRPTVLKATRVSNTPPSQSYTDTSNILRPRKPFTMKMLPSKIERIINNK